MSRLFSKPLLKYTKTTRGHYLKKCEEIVRIEYFNTQIRLKLIRNKLHNKKKCKGAIKTKIFFFSSFIFQPILQTLIQYNVYKRQITAYNNKPQETSPPY